MMKQQCRAPAFVAMASAVGLSACATIETPLRSATGLSSQIICSEMYVSGLPPAQVYAETVRPWRGFGWIDWGLHYEVDATTKRVTTTFIGGLGSTAAYRDGMGCALVDGSDARSLPSARPRQPASMPEIGPDTVVVPATSELRAALDAAFTEERAPPFHGTKAIVVVKDGRIVAERYARGYGIDTPMISWSVAKSVVNALVGILVREGRLSVSAAPPIAPWIEPRDPHHAVTVDELLRQTSGLHVPQTNSGADASSRMKFVEVDPAAFALRAPLDATPGATWSYTDANYVVLSRMIRDLTGGQAADVVDFASRELFEPLGMRHASLALDATGTPQGADLVFASARDWARFGLLYLNDGLAGERRILPPAWVRYSTSRTLDTGYGAGFFLNVTGSANVPEWGVPWGMPHAPPDTFFARGFMGQYVVVVPSERLVVVRFGVSHVKGDDVESADRLVADVVQATRAIGEVPP
jgi:CubicO group peptidase (beta-lactamase class C family)